MDRQPCAAGRQFRPVGLTAPAKINLALHVTGRRPDGYHLLESLVVFSEFGDRLSFEAADEHSLVVTGPYAGDVPTGGDNLVIAARKTLREAVIEFGEISPSPVLIRLEKHLPVASGIGGGSSDAATALRGLDVLWNLALSSDRLAGIGRSLGADVPMCLVGKPLVARGIGEIVEPLAAFPRLPMVLVNPGVPVATPAVFATLSTRDNPPLPAMPKSPGLAALLAWLSLTRNDLEEPAIRLAPPIAEALLALRANDAAFARMSGSGATCFGLFASASAADAAAESIRCAQPGWFVAATKST